MERTLRLALFGIPGAGKSTAGQLIQDYCADFAVAFHLIKLADPLYEAQSCIYRAAGRPLADFYEHDGKLLNFLGDYIRKLNPTVLADRFTERLGGIFADPSRPSDIRSVIVCDDMRRLDTDFLREIGFTFVRIVADENKCQNRRLARGDRSFSSLQHPVEQGLDDIRQDETLVNEETVDELRQQVVSLLGRLLSDSNW